MMDLCFAPGPVRSCCEKLREAGFTAYPVGGCVRDLILGRRPEDWDITTSAQPSEVAALFPQTIPTGFRHGTVTVILEEMALEVTAFRTDGSYTDGRHPDQVTFGATLAEDLSRRDFTMNAMALGADGSLIDFFGGRCDLAGRLIRCVGDPDRRFQEDALRILRAVRFSAQLDFELEPATNAALVRNRERLSLVSVERVRVEVEKLLLSPRPERGAALFSMGLLQRFLTGAGTPDLAALHWTRRGAPERWAGLCALLRRAGAIEDAGEFTRSLRLDRRTVQSCHDGQRLWEQGLPQDARSWRHAASKWGISACRAAAAMGEAAEGGAHLTDGLEAVLVSGAALGVRDLALTGADLVALGLEGAEVGKAQKKLLLHVLDHPEENSKSALVMHLNQSGRGD